MEPAAFGSDAQAMRTKPECVPKQTNGATKDIINNHVIVSEAMLSDNVVLLPGWSGDFNSI